MSGSADSDSSGAQFQGFDRLPSKRKLEDYDSLAGEDAGFRRTSVSKGKSVVEPSSAVHGESSGGCSNMQVQFFVRMISGGKTLVLQANLKDTVELVHQK